MKYQYRFPRIRFKSDTTQNIGIGFAPKFCTRGFNQSLMTFDNQYNNDTYDASSPSGESFNNSSLNWFDFTTGLSWQKQIKPRQVIQAGYALSHPLAPKQSFFNESAVTLDSKHIVNINYSHPITALVDLQPMVMLETQGKYKETLIGINAKYYLDPKAQAAVYGGLLLRLKDAIVMYSAFDYNNFSVGLSYDINTSSLKPASRGKGGFELSLKYIIKKFVPVKTGKTVCPVFL